MTTNDQKPITLIVTIYPLKKNTRRVVVSGAPEGEMPLIMDGLFPDRHALLDRVFALVLKRDPQVVTIAEPKTKTGKAKSITAGADDDEEETETTDQLVTGDTVPVSPSTEAENLPAIEGDDAPSKELDARLQPASIAVGEMSTLEEQILEWKEEDHGEQD
ncbi:MAG: hypothetical protein ACOYBO_10715 [Azonexus sp.]